MLRIALRIDAVWSPDEVDGETRLSRFDAGDTHDEAETGGLEIERAEGDADFEDALVGAAVIDALAALLVAATETTGCAKLAELPLDDP